MPVIYLRHPVHGEKVACCEPEAVSDEKNGWVRFEAGILLTPEVPALPEAKDTLTDLREQWETKYGKPPHHRKSIDTLRAELMD